jgi:tetratricopeptide (TPR) repeat protein
MMFMKLKLATFITAALIGLGSLQAQDSYMSSESSSTIQKVNQLANEKKYDLALSLLDDLIRHDPGNIRAYKLRGHVLFAMEKPGQALDDFDAVIAMVPDSANAFVDRAIVHLALNNHESAMADIDQALQLKPNSSFAKTVKSKITAEIEGPKPEKKKK